MCPNLRIVLCEACGSEGRIYFDVSDRDGPMEASEPCPWCDGTGGELVEVLPITMEDLDELVGVLIPND